MLLLRVKGSSYVLNSLVIKQRRRKTMMLLLRDPFEAMNRLFEDSFIGPRFEFLTRRRQMIKSTSYSRRLSQVSSRRRCRLQRKVTH